MAEQLFGIAIGTSLAAAEAVGHLTSFLRSKGFADPPAAYDSCGEYLHFMVLNRNDGGSWYLLEEQTSSRLSLFTQLARHTQQPLDAFEVSGVEKPVRNPDGELGYPIDVRAHHIAPDGSLMPSRLATAIDAPDTRRANGDFYETVSFVLWNTIEGALPPSLEPTARLVFYRAQVTDLSPRLQGILDSAEAASSIVLQQMEGQQFLKLTLPSGNRLVRVTQDDLQQLRAASQKIP